MIRHLFKKKKKPGNVFASYRISTKKERRIITNPHYIYLSQCSSREPEKALPEALELRKELNYNIELNCITIP